MKIVFASNNPGKVAEINQLLADTDITVSPQSDFNVSEAAETGTTFVENAIIKARHASAVTQLPAIADDSGIEIDALGGAPGVISARYGGEHGNDAKNIERVLTELGEAPIDERSARFRCVIVMMRDANDACPLICQGTWEGRILSARQGEKGFGYDPIFYVPEQHCSAAELAPKLKNQISHRGQAMRQLIAHLQAPTAVK